MAAAARTLALTMGDPAGIGPEVIEGAWRRRESENLPAFAVFADPSCFSVPVQLIEDVGEATQAFATALPVIPLKLERSIRPGQPDKANAGTVINSIERAVASNAAAIVTAPIAKAVLYDAGFTYPGQTEFLAYLTKTDVTDTVMMLASSALRVVPLTIHIPLKDVPTRLTKDLIISRARVTAHALKRDFAIEKPRLAFCGLNPHAGENGALGHEEKDIIIPALEALRAEGIDARGPFPADTMFHEDARRDYDAALAMYHDQALIPLKTLDFHGGVNTTLGLPIIRTSPDHGTAFDIAGKGIANPSSMIAAIRLADHMVVHRARHDA